MLDVFSQLFRTGELERMNDHAYERLRARAEAREGDGAMLVGAACAVLGAALWATGGFTLAWLIGTAASPSPRFTVLNITLALGAGFVVYRLVREWRLGAAMRRLLNRAGCPYCEFSLVGLKPKMGAVTCPECGQMVALAEHHIDPSWIMLPKDIPVPEAGPLGSFKGEVPKGRQRRIVRPFGGIRRPPPPGPSAPSQGEVL